MFRTIKKVGNRLTAFFMDGTSDRIATYEEGTWTPSRVSSANLTTSPVFGTARWVRVGNQVTAYIDEITNVSVTTAGSAFTRLTIAATGLPGVVNSTKYSGAARCCAAAATNESLSVGITDMSTSNTDIIMQFDASTPGLGSELLLIQSVFFSYLIV